MPLGGASGEYGNSLYRDGTETRPTWTLAAPYVDGKPYMRIRTVTP